MPDIGRWLGLSHKVGGLMSYQILTQKGIVISRTTVQCLTSLENETDYVKASVREFATDISSCLKDKEDLTYDGSKSNPEDQSKYVKYDQDFQEEFDSIINYSNDLEADANFMQYVFNDRYLNMELQIPRDGDGPEFTTVNKRLRYKDGLPIDRGHNNAILDTRFYKVYNNCRHKALLAANAIAENIRQPFY